MKMQELSLEFADSEDLRYRISECFDCASLEASLGEIGQLNPVILLEAAGSPGSVVSGFRRLHALRRIGRRSFLARVLPAAEYSPLEAFRLALWDNLSHRKLNALEKARVLNTLKDLCGVEQDVLVRDYLPLLELAPHQNVLRSYLSLHGMLPELKHFLLDGSLTIPSAERICARGPHDQLVLAGLFDKARWSTSLQRQMLDLAEELAAVAGGGMAEVFGRPEVAAVLDDVCLSPFQKGERVFEALYCRRNPRLSNARRIFLKEKNKLDLPGAVHLTPEPFFETSRLRVEFDVCSAEGFRDILSALQRAAETPAFDNLFRVS